MSYSVQLFLYAKSGGPLKNAGQDVCNPCTYKFGPGVPPQHIVRVEDLLLAKGPFTTALAYALLKAPVATSDDFDVTAMIVNSKSSAFDVDVSWVPVRRF